jgi:hypothetical protein
VVNTPQAHKTVTKILLSISSEKINYILKTFLMSTKIRRIDYLWHHIEDLRNNSGSDE